MATPINGSSVILYTIEYNRAGQRMMTNQLFTTTTAGTIADYQADFTTALNTFNGAGQFVAKMKALSPTFLTFVKHSLQPIYPNRYAAVTINFAGGTVGTRTGSSLPPNTALTMNKVSINATRWGRGSAHLPIGVITDTGSDGLWNAGMLTDAADLGTFWKTPWDSGNFSYTFIPILWNRANVSRQTRITNVLPMDTIRTERRRTVRVGI